jgi:hypothetical protein
LACLVIFKVDISPLKQLGELTGLDTNVVLLVIAAAISGVLGSLSKDPKK